MLNLEQDKVPCSQLRKRMEYFLKQKWIYPGNIARMKANRWIKLCTEWKNQGEGKDQEDDQAEGGRMTKQRRRNFTEQDSFKHTTM